MATEFEKEQDKGPLSPGERDELARLQRRVQQHYEAAQGIHPALREQFLDAGQEDDDRRMSLLSKLLSWLRRQP